MTNLQSYARAAGVLLLISVFAGFIGEMYVPGKMISKDPAVTARNVLENEMLFRQGFAAYLVEALCDASLALVFYVLLKPVDRNLSLLAAFFGLIATATFATSEMFYYAALPVLKAAGVAPDLRSALALLSLRVYAITSGIFMAFYGSACIVRGVLIFRSRYLPKFLGVLLAIAGAGFIAKNFTLLLTPGWSPDLLLAPTFVAVLAMAGWFLIKGVASPDARMDPRSGGPQLRPEA